MAREEGIVKGILPFGSPCKDCETKAFKCHGTCEKYAAFRAECAKFAEERKRQREINEYLSEAKKHFPPERRI